jgi:hypothetical protein
LLFHQILQLPLLLNQPPNVISLTLH